MTEVITIDRIMSFLYESADFKPDQTQVDAVKVMLESYALNLAKSMGAPQALLDAHYDTVTALGTQLLDTGGRMRLHRDGMLDDPSSPLATAEDVRLLGAAVQGRFQSLEKMIGDAAKPVDETSLLDRVDRAERRMTKRLTDLADGLQELSDNPVEVTVAGSDLSPVQSQLDTLTKLILAQPAASLEGKIVAAIGDLAELCEDVAELRAEVRALARALERAQAKLPEYRLVPVGEPELPDWERDLIEGKIPTVADVLVLSDDEPAMVALDAIDAIRDEYLTEKSKYAHEQPVKPGCFFNEDGSITCKICGVAKMPSDVPPDSAYYKDKQSRTGFKAACKDCERAGKGRAA